MGHRDPSGARATAADFHERYAPGLDHLAFHAESRDDVDDPYATLVDSGYPVADPPGEYDYSPGYYAAAFDDPDGIRLEVVYEPEANSSSSATAPRSAD